MGISRCFSLLGCLPHYGIVRLPIARSPFSSRVFYGLAVWRGEINDVLLDWLFVSASQRFVMNKEFTWYSVQALVEKVPADFLVGYYWLSYSAGIRTRLVNRDHHHMCDELKKAFYDACLYCFALWEHQKKETMVQSSPTNPQLNGLHQ
jgi:hypothetical protein